VGHPPLSNHAAALLTSSGFVDQICIIDPTGKLVPEVEPPQSPLSGTKIDSDTQAWFVGSSENGQGLQVQTDTLQRYIDHGEHLSIVSPAP
jgi:hypothetical protein